VGSSTSDIVKWEQLKQGMAVYYKPHGEQVNARDRFKKFRQIRSVRSTQMTSTSLFLLAPVLLKLLHRTCEDK
jgi:hypothetical protein